MQEIHAVRTTAAPTPLAGAPYSQAVTHAGLVYVSGQIGLDPETGNLVEGGIEAQSEQVLRNVTAILAAAGSGLDRVLRSTVYLAELEDWPTLNEVYRRHFDDPAPARTAFQVAGLPAGALVEVDVVAALAADTGPRQG